MDFIDLAKKRYSVRQYQTEKVEKEKLDKILEAAHAAPTAHNAQPEKVLVIQTPEGLEKLKKAGNVYGAPLAFVVCADHGESWKRPYDNWDSGEVDAAIITSHMLLEAADLGLGSIWVCFFKPDVLSAEFNLPANVQPVNILGVGYAAGEAKSPDRHATERKPLEQTVFYETF